ANLDWYEAGRSDGVLGYSIGKLDSYRQRCDSTDAPVKTDAYVNGRDAGLVDFCSATGGLEAGKSGIPYEKVCPENMEPMFLTHYEIGKRIRELENESSYLESRIDNLSELLSPVRAGGSVREKIDELRGRRAQIDRELIDLESKATEF